jgi:hypothetical protein
MAMIVVAAGGISCYLAVSYALHHPGSFLAQSTLAFLQLANEHPLYKAAGTVGRTAYRIAGEAGASNQLTPEEEEQLLRVPPEPLPVEDAAPVEKPDPCQEQGNFILQTIKQELPHTDLKPVAHTETAVLDKEDDFPATMPHCLDMEDGADETTPSADSKSTRSTDPLFKFWLDLFESAAQESGEEPRYFHDEEPPRCLEDPAYDYQYPGCPYTGKCPHEERSGTPKITDPVPTAKPEKSSGVDHRTPIIGTIPYDSPRPLCEYPPEEDTVLHTLAQKSHVDLSFDSDSKEDVQIVSECVIDRIDPIRFFPLIGQAQMHHCQWKCTVYYYETAQTEDSEGVHDKKPRVQVVYIDNDHLHLINPSETETKGKTSVGRKMTDPKKYELPARLRQLVPGDSTEAQEDPAHAEVDTTEFRPSDAKPGEFDPKPM